MWAGSIEEEGEEGEEGGGGGRGGNGERSGEKGETPVQLKELLKTEREQKVGRFPHLIPLLYSFFLHSELFRRACIS